MNKRKRVALFGSGLTNRYKLGLCRVFNIAAEELDMDLVIFNTYGRIGYENALSEDYESEILNYIDLDQFDGIVFDGDGYNVDGVSDKIQKKLLTAKCPVVSISSYVEGFYNIEFDDAGGLRTIVEHFINHHHFKNIGFMSGYLTHPDAQIRLNEFKSVMKQYGLPEEGAGIFEGDFWYNMGMDAARYFLSLSTRPDAIVCANDYMAISLIMAFRKLGIAVPDDIAVSGYDGTPEGQEFLPHMTSVTRERKDIAWKTLKFISDVADGKDMSCADLKIYPKPIYGQSCGCHTLDYNYAIDTVIRLYEEKRTTNAATFNAELAIVNLNRLNTIRQMEQIFSQNANEFGDYLSFFFMVHVDSDGVPVYDSDYIKPSGNFIPAIWIDKNKEYTKSPHRLNSSSIVPVSDVDRRHTYYIMSVHGAETMVGYSIVEMSGNDIFNEWYNVWLLNLGMTINSIQRKDRIFKLVDRLKTKSTTDELTGMLNRRGFDNKSRDIISRLTLTKTICTMVIDMDGLKHINDNFGHLEGDRAIKALADMIVKSCKYGEISGRVGGDEFYIFALDYSENKLNKFIESMKQLLKEYNDVNNKEYRLDFSMGSYITDTDAYGQIESFLKISDERMYQQKMSKPNRRK